MGIHAGQSSSSAPPCDGAGYLLVVHLQHAVLTFVSVEEERKEQVPPPLTPHPPMTVLPEPAVPSHAPTLLSPLPPPPSTGANTTHSCTSSCTITYSMLPGPKTLTIPSHFELFFPPLTVRCHLNLQRHVVIQKVLGASDFS